MSAERLREAAKVLRERPSWHVVEITDGRNTTTAYRKGGRFYLDRQGDEFGTERIPLGGQTGEFYPLANPGVGLALADWLDTAGADLWAHGPLCDCGSGCTACDDDVWQPHVRRALALADLILGGTP